MRQSRAIRRKRARLLCNRRRKDREIGYPRSLIIHICIRTSPAQSLYEARQMRQVAVLSFVLAALLAVASYNPVSAEIEAGGSVIVDACATDTSRLGISRVVEVDTVGGAD